MLAHRTGPYTFINATDPIRLVVRAAERSEVSAARGPQTRFRATARILPITSQAPPLRVRERHGPAGEPRRELTRNRAFGASMRPGDLLAKDPAPVPRVDVRERLRENPLMAPRVLGGVLTLAVHVVGGLLEDLRSVGSRTLAVRRRIVHAY